MDPEGTIAVGFMATAGIEGATALAGGTEGGMAAATTTGELGAGVETNGGTVAIF